MQHKRATVVLAAVAFLALGIGFTDLLQKSGLGRPVKSTAVGTDRPAASRRGTFTFDDAPATSSSSAVNAKTGQSGKDPLEAAIEPLRGSVVVSFGKVEDIGKQAGYILPLLAEMRSLSSSDPSRLTADQRSHLLDLQRRYADLLGVLPEIAGFQNVPAEYGKFFSNMARQAAGLDAWQTAQVDNFMRARANEMIQAGLNDAKKPADPAQMDAWESRRDQFNEQTIAGLREVLTPEVATRAGLNEQTMEFFETDFDKARLQPALN